MSQQGPQYGYSPSPLPGRPAPSQPGYPQAPHPITQPGYPQAPYPASPYTNPGYPPNHHPGAVFRPAPGYPVPPGPRPRRALRILLPLCVVLALLFAGTAYFLFFSGASPSDVVTEYISDAQKGDFAAARELAASDAPDAVKFRDNAEGMETMRRWFTDSHMSFNIRSDTATGTKSTVIVDKTLTLPNYEGPVHMRWDYHLLRESGEWRIKGAKIMTVVDLDAASPGDCLRSLGFSYETADCSDQPASADEEILTITDRVKQPSDCPNPKAEMVETKDHAILCLDVVTPER